MIRKIHSGTLDPHISKREKEHGNLARKAAAEGIVLLKNEGLLPLEMDIPIVLLGNGAARTIKGGTGSGDVNERKSVSIYEGMQAAGACFASEKWVKDYDQCYMNARYEWKDRVLEAAKTADNVFEAYAARPFALPDGRKVTAEDVEGAKAAVYVVSRIAGEGKDRHAIEGDYYLSQREKENLRYLDQKRIPTILIINAGGPVEITDILKETKNIKAVLHISQLGQEGGHAVADVLFGKAVPGGRLSSTWAKRYSDYPYGESFSHLNGDLSKEEYREGIYVGYRYFDTFGVEPLFPFGYGLSYTTFEMTFEALRIENTQIVVDVLVKNTGGVYAGKEVVQIYVALPKGEMQKECHRLAGFAKTKELGAEEAEQVTIVIDQKRLASFSEKEHAWIIEKGIYGICLGTNAASMQIIATIKVEKTVYLEKNQAICPKKVDFEELDGPKTEKRWVEEVPEFLFMPKEEEKKECIQYFADQQSVEELMPLLYGNIPVPGSGSGKLVPGSPGKTTEALAKKYGIRSLMMADGPAGVRLRKYYEVDKATDQVYELSVLGSVEHGFLEPTERHEGADTYYQYCTAFPVGTALAQTWNQELMYKIGEAIAVEMQEFGIDLWLAPGMNIHRNPLCGRNFEYYSEDPVLSGMMAAAVTLGVQSKKGCGVTIKHFACNNQEDNRMYVDACVSERALREIYLQGFEIAIKKSQPAAIMTSYNLINGVHAANSYDLCTVAAREEWGFEGIIMTDWNTTIPEEGSSIPWQCTTAGNDLIMPGYLPDAENIREAYESGKLQEKDIRICAGRMIALVGRLTE